MIKKVKNIILNIDRFLYKKFGSYKTTKSLENIKEAQILFSCFSKTGEESPLKFVGGCVRKAICGEPIDDIDLATSLEPNEVKRKLHNAEIKTGIISTSSVTHATPACFYGHQINRYGVDESLAKQFLNSNINVLICGGEDFFKNRSDNLILIDSFRNLWLKKITKIFCTALFVEKVNMK